MRVAVDARPLQHGRGGVARYVAELLPLVAAEVRVLALVDARAPAPPAPAGVEVVPVSAPPAVPGLGWLDLGAGPWVRRHRADVELFHGAYYAVPHRLPVPSVTTFHDIAWETNPEDFGRAKLAAWRAHGRHAARVSARLVVDSSFSGDDVTRTYGVPPERIDVIPIGRPSGFAPGQAPPGHLGVRPPYVVAMGGAARRRLGEAVEAWRVARRTCPPLQLAVVGGEAPPGGDGIVDLGYVDDADWPPLLAGAEALVYATRFEGFGLPALEAALSGTPCVCAPVASLPEVLGDAGTWAEAPTGPALGAALAALLADPEAHAAARTAVLDRAAAAPTWDDAAAAHLRTYRAAVA